MIEARNYRWMCASCGTYLSCDCISCGNPETQRPVLIAARPIGEDQLIAQLRDYIAGEPLSDPIAVDLCRQVLALLGEKP